MWRLILSICVTQTFKFRHRSIFPWQKVTSLALLVEPKRNEGVFGALCNLLLQAKIKLSQSRLIYYQSSCLFWSCPSRETDSDVPCTAATSAHGCYTDKCSFVVFTSLLMPFVFTPLHTLIHPIIGIKPWWVLHRNVCEHAYLELFYLDEAAAGRRSKRLLFLVTFALKANGYTE